MRDTSWRNDDGERQLDPLVQQAVENNCVKAANSVNAEITCFTALTKMIITRETLGNERNDMRHPPGLLSRERTVAGPGFSRWMVPPAALSVHLCIGQAYAFSVFNLPMTRLIGITQSAPDDWKLTMLGWIFSIAIVFLGFVRGGLRQMAGGRRPAPGDVHRRRCASAAASSWPPSASSCTRSGWSISATASSAASVSASATFRPSRR